LTPRRPVDLDRAREALADLDATLERHPDTRSLPAGALDSDAALAALGTLEAPPMAQLVVRLPSETMERLAALVPRVAADPAARAWGRVTRSTVLRLALEDGLSTLEARYPPPAPPSRSR